MTADPRLLRIVAAQPYPLLFATISGAHLYGFPSPDSDYDLRGAHILPLEIITGLEIRDETVEDSRIIEGLEMDIVSHDLRKFLTLLLRKNGYVLEQLFSPLVVSTSATHQELKAIALHKPNGDGVVTRNHSHHYFGFVDTQWKLFTKETPNRVKPLLYVYRVLLTGIWMMRTGQVEANLVTLNEYFKLPQIPDLIAQKLGGLEQSILSESAIPFHESEFNRLKVELQSAMDNSSLPETPTERTRAAINDLLVRVRMASV
ncbi:MAG: nucleotidyltransferase domain-containing protein [Verrucomicrobiota bacterium]|nr:nucleotidyltransferase domain-containing protein [Verrucomicrobiota bacterium]